MRHLFALALFSSLFLGCGTREGEEVRTYSFYKASISQSELLHDEAEVRGTAGVIHVISRQNAGGGSLEVEVDDDHHILVQQKLTDMGYSKGIH